MKKVSLILSAVVMAAMMLSSCGGETSNQSTTETVVTEKKEILFDVPSLVDKNIDEIRKVLGKPSSDSEPTKLQLKTGINEWEKIFEKEGYELMITYNALTRKIIDFFMSTNDPSGKTKNYSDLLQVMNVEENSPTFIVEPVKTIQDPNFFTGVKITKK